MAMLGVGGRIFNLAPLTVEDLALAYDVESQFASQFPSAAPSIANDRINMTLAGVDFVAASRSGYAIDGDALHDEAILTITMQAGSIVFAKGGNGGKGGDGISDPEFPISSAGSVGEDGGTAIRYGCETNIIGTGTITKGYGGGGGGGGFADISNGYGGGGGGGSAALGAGGALGSGSDTDGVAGSVATTTALGAGGSAGNPSAGDGGDGGDSGTAQQAGSAGSKAGGAAGSDGDAIDSQGFTHSEGGGITITGGII